MVLDGEFMEAMRLTSLSHTDPLSFLPLPHMSPAVLSASDGVMRELAATLGEADLLAGMRDAQRLLASVDVGYLRLVEAGDAERSSQGERHVVTEPAVLRGNDAFTAALPVSAAPAFHSGDGSSILNQREGGGHIEPGYQPAPKRRRSSMGAQSTVRPPSALIDEFSRAVDNASKGVDQEEQDCGFLKLRQQLPDWIELASKLRQANLLRDVPEAEISRFLSILELPIGSGCVTLESNVTVNSGPVQEVQAALLSVHLALQIVSSPGLPKSVLKEELLEKMVDTIAFQIRDNILPAYDPALRRDKDAAGDDEAVPVSRSSKSKPKGKGRSGSSGCGAAEAISDGVCSLLPLVASLLASTRLPDEVVLRLTQACLATFSVSSNKDSVLLLQLKAMAVLSTAFQEHPQYHLSIVDDVVHLLARHPITKKQPKAYRLREDVTQIHVLSALILQLLQCSVKLPPNRSPPLDPTKVDPPKAPVKKKRSAKGAKAADKAPEPAPEPVVEMEDLGQGFGQAVDLARSFWKALLERRSASRIATDAAEARATVEELVEDFLTVLNCPEFPAASVLLQALSVSLDKNAGLGSEDAALRGAAIDLLGLIACRLKYHDLATHNIRRQALMIGAHPSGTGAEAEVDTMRGVKAEAPAQNGMWPESQECYVCLEALGDPADPSLCCSTCPRSCHARCQGGGGTLSESWICHVCDAQKRLLPHHPSEAQPSGSLLLQQLVVDHLLAGSTAASSSAVRFLAAMWSMEAKGASSSKDSKDALNGPLGLSSLWRSWLAEIERPEGHTPATASPLPRHVVLEICQMLEAERPLARSFDALVSRLLVCLRDKPVLRAKAMKAVSGIIEADPSELSKEHVRKEVEERFLDTSISVREAAIDLVGKHMLQRPDVAAQYYEVICDRFTDRGVSVRKRAIKIVRGLCLQAQGFEHAVDACARIFSRFNDEEASIRDLVMKTVHELWFEARAEGGQSLEDSVVQATSQLVEVMKQPRLQQAVVSVIRQSMFDDGDAKGAAAGVKKEEAGVETASVSRVPKSKSGQQNKAVRQRSELMCRGLLESIIKAQEQNVEDDKALPYLVALQVFCEVDPTLCVPPMDPSRYATTLMPYITSQVDRRTKPQQGAAAASGARMCEAIVSIISMLLPHIRRPPASLVESLQRCLAKFTATHESTAVVQASVKCLCRLQDACKEPLPSLFDLVSKFYNALQAPTSTKSCNPRYLFALGLFCRHGAKHLDSGELSSPSVGDITDTLKLHFKSETPLIKMKALQALGLVCLAIPDEMEKPDILQAYSECLDPQAPPHLKAQALRNLCDFALVSEEKPKVEPCSEDSDDEQEQVTVAVAAGAGDTVTASGPIQRHWNRVLDCLFSSHQDVQQAALKLVEVALGQGIVFPVTCVGHLIALAAEATEVVRSTALRLVTLINSRWGGYKFVENKFSEGFQRAYAQLSRTWQAASSSPSPSPGKQGKNKGRQVPAHVKEGLGRVYMLLRSTGSSKQNVLTPLVKRFDHIDSPLKIDLGFLLFCTEVLASLPFSLQDEVLFLVTETSRVVHRRGGSLLAVLKGLITEDGPLAAPAQAAFEQMVKERNSKKGGARAEEKETEKGGEAEADPLAGTAEAEALQSAREHADAAGAISLLLLLKSWLKNAFNLSDAKCLAYGHAESTKSQEHVSRKESASLDLRPVSFHHPKELCRIVQQFQLLKRLMKEESGDYVGIVSGSPKPTKRGKQAQAPSSAPPPTGPPPSEGNGDGEDAPSPGPAEPAMRSAPPKRSSSKRGYPVERHIVFNAQEG